MRDGDVPGRRDGEIFYSLAGNEIVEQRFDLTLTDPGARRAARPAAHAAASAEGRKRRSMAAALDIAAGNAAVAQQIAFFRNQARLALLDRDRREADAGAGGDAAPAAGTSRPRRECRRRRRSFMGPEGQAAGADGAGRAARRDAEDERRERRAGVPDAAAGARHVGGTTFASTESLMQSLDRLRPRLRAQPYRGGLRPALRARGPIPTNMSSFPPRRCCARPSRIASRAWRGRFRAASTRRTKRARSRNCRRPTDGDEPRVQQQVVPLSVRGEAADAASAAATAGARAGTRGRGDAAERLYATLRSHDHFTRH